MVIIDTLREPSHARFPLTARSYEFPIGQTLLGVSTNEDQEFEGDELCLDQVKLYFEDTERNITWITMMQLAETGFQEWNDPEEDIYNDEA